MTINTFFSEYYNVTNSLKVYNYIEIIFQSLYTTSQKKNPASPLQVPNIECFWGNKYWPSITRNVWNTKFHSVGKMQGFRKANAGLGGTCIYYSVLEG